MIQISNKSDVRSRYCKELWENGVWERWSVHCEDLLDELCRFFEGFFRHRVASIKSYEKNEVSTVERDLRRAESIVKKTS